MKKIYIAACVFLAPFAAFAKYGIDESMSESSGDIGDMVLGGLLVWGIYLLWKKFFG